MGPSSIAQSVAERAARKKVFTPAVEDSSSSDRDEDEDEDEGDNEAET